ncbi:MULTISPECIES: TetR/AcrR family transcriptional regulator [unclassified Sphingopyxis]|uniref:TetR/AcrR family transcriptional regulator n=1 Tax=unclassified Sphingopyxis TaxID=2614943 RepID=UPI000735FEC8|nr:MULTISPECIES: TetR/AcrR family transcriptional regulator [unclassified Sphingopyxis]KTE38775.1 TetR family transcriptional regulator [Sphingopyxis sp. HIX]KTE83277.1 TetR family transcriptional regulator [Sphingopyxis sp. HXXIV]
MGRSKRISDEAALEALLDAVEAAGPDGLTFARASAATGLSAATLVQRFGTRDAMVEAVLLHAWDRLDALTAAAAADTPSTPAGAIALLLRLMPGGTAAHAMTEGLLLLREDVRNPLLRARGRAWGEYLAKALGRRLPLQATADDQIGWQMLAVWQGTLIWWAFKREGDPETEIREALERWWRSVDRSLDP